LKTGLNMLKTNYYDNFLQKLKDIALFSREKQEKSFCFYFLANPASGLLKSKGSVKRLLKTAECYLSMTKTKTYKRKVDKIDVYETICPGHATKITEKIIDSLKKSQEHIIVCTGGDGTSNEICSALVKHKSELSENIKLIRLPFGTGNDNASCQTMEEACKLIQGPLNSIKTAYIEIKTKDASSYYAFNIVSLGIDAYICELTNKYKRIFPGDMYKFMVDAGVLFYDLKVKPLPMKISFHDKSGFKASYVFKPLLAAFGVSGKRTYGMKKKILPGEDNICTTSQMNLLKRLKCKELYYTGEHGSLEEVSFFKSNQIAVEFGGPIPMQMDGEVVWLNKDSFPLTIQIKDPVLPLIKR
jgi:diacylglycerol kinase family enzyme